MAYNDKKRGGNMVDVIREAADYGGAMGHLVGSNSAVVASDLMWFLHEANLGPLGQRTVAVASIPKDRQLSGGEYTIKLDDGRAYRAWLVDDAVLPPAGTRKVSFVVENI